MFGEAGKVVVVDVLGCEFPGRLAVLVDGDGSESGECDVFDQVQTDSWIVCDAESFGLRMAQATPSTEIRECANGIYAEDACGRWLVSADAGSGVVERVAERNCGSTIGREESVKPCGPSCGLQGNEAARCELVFDGSDCCNLEWKLSESAPGDGFVEQCSDEPRTSSRSAGVSSHLHNDGVARPDKELDFTATGLMTGRLHAGCDLLCGRCGVDWCIDVCCRNNGDRGDCKTERGRSVSWCTENTLDEFPEDDGQKHHGGRIGCGVGGSVVVGGIKGVLGRECKTCDRTQISLSRQMYGEVEASSEFFMAPQVVAVEHCKKLQCGRPFSEVRVSGRRSTPKETKLRAGARGWWRTSSA